MFRPIRDRRFGTAKRLNAVVLWLALAGIGVFVALILIKTFSLFLGVGLLAAAILYGRSHARRQEIYRRQHSDIAALVGISPIDFEKHVAETYRRSGYNVQLTRGSGDQGLDIIASAANQKLGVQCKRYTGVVGNDAVQQAFAGKSYYSCGAAIVVTTGDFTPSARDLARKLNVQLVSGKEYSNWLASFAVPMPTATYKLSDWFPQGRPLLIQIGLAVVGLLVLMSMGTSIPTVSDIASGFSQRHSQGTLVSDPNPSYQSISGFDDRVQAFYSALNRRDFDEAYSMLSPAFKQGGTFEQWKAGYDTTESIAVSTSTLSPSLVSIDMTAIDHYPQGDVTRHFVGNWHGTRGADGEWYLDSGHFDVVK